MASPLNRNVQSELQSIIAKEHRIEFNKESEEKNAPVYIKPLTEVQMSRRRVIQNRTLVLSPNPSLPVGEHRTLTFTVLELFQYIAGTLHGVGILSDHPSYIGGAAANILVGLEYIDVDVVFSINTPNFEIIKNFFISFIAIRLGLNSQDQNMIEEIPNIYLHRKMIIRNPHGAPIGSIFSIGKCDIKFIYDNTQRQNISSSDGLRVFIFVNSSICINNHTFCSAQGYETALKALYCRRVDILDPRGVINLISRLALKLTQGFDIKISDALIALELLQKEFPARSLRNYSVGSPSSFIQNFQRHQQNHYPDDEIGQILELFNWLSLVCHITDLEVRHIYFRALAFASQQLPGSKQHIEIRHRLTTLIQQHPEATGEFLSFIKGAFFYEWVRGNPRLAGYLFSFNDNPLNARFQFSLTHHFGTHYLSIPPQSPEDLVINFLRSWQTIEQRLGAASREALSTLSRVLEIFHFSFFAISSKQIVIRELMEAFDTPPLLNYLTIFQEHHPAKLFEFLRKEMPEVTDRFVLANISLRADLRRCQRERRQLRDDKGEKLFAVLLQLAQNMFSIRATEMPVENTLQQLKLLLTDLQQFDRSTLHEDSFLMQTMSRTLFHVSSALIAAIESLQKTLAHDNQEQQVYQYLYALVTLPHHAEHRASILNIFHTVLASIKDKKLSPESLKSIALIAEKLLPQYPLQQEESRSLYQIVDHLLSLSSKQIEERAIREKYQKLGIKVLNLLEKLYQSEWKKELQTLLLKRMAASFLATTPSRNQELLTTYGKAFVGLESVKTNRKIAAFPLAELMNITSNETRSLAVRRLIQVASQVNMSLAESILKNLQDQMFSLDVQCTHFSLLRKFASEDDFRALNQAYKTWGRSLETPSKIHVEHSAKFLLNKILTASEILKAMLDKSGKEENEETEKTVEEIAKGLIRSIQERSIGKLTQEASEKASQFLLQTMKQLSSQCIPRRIQLAEKILSASKELPRFQCLRREALWVLIQQCVNQGILPSSSIINAYLNEDFSKMDKACSRQEFQKTNCLLIEQLLKQGPTSGRPESYSTAFEIFQRFLESSAAEGVLSLPIETLCVKILEAYPISSISSKITDDNLGQFVLNLIANNHFDNMTLDNRDLFLQSFIKTERVDLIKSLWRPIRLYILSSPIITQHLCQAICETRNCELIAMMHVIFLESGGKNLTVCCDMLTGFSMTSDKRFLLFIQENVLTPRLLETSFFDEERTRAVCAIAKFMANLAREETDISILSTYGALLERVWALHPASVSLACEERKLTTDYLISVLTKWGSNQALRKACHYFKLDDGGSLAWENMFKILNSVARLPSARYSTHLMNLLFTTMEWVSIHHAVGINAPETEILFKILKGMQHSLDTKYLTIAHGLSCIFLRCEMKIMSSLSEGGKNLGQSQRKMSVLLQHTTQKQVHQLLGSLAQGLADTGLFHKIPKVDKFAMQYLNAKNINQFQERINKILTHNFIRVRELSPKQADDKTIRELFCLSRRILPLYVIYDPEKGRELVRSLAQCVIRLSSKWSVDVSDLISKSHRLGLYSMKRIAHHRVIPLEAKDLQSVGTERMWLEIDVIRSLCKCSMRETMPVAMNRLFFFSKFFDMKSPCVFNHLLGASRLVHDRVLLDIMGVQMDSKVVHSEYSVHYVPILQTFLEIGADLDHQDQLFEYFKNTLMRSMTYPFVIRTVHQIAVSKIAATQSPLSVLAVIKELVCESGMNHHLLNNTALRDLENLKEKPIPIDEALVFVDYLNETELAYILTDQGQSQACLLVIEMLEAFLSFSKEREMAIVRGARLLILVKNFATLLLNAELCRKFLLLLNQRTCHWQSENKVWLSSLVIPTRNSPSQHLEDHV